MCSFALTSWEASNECCWCVSCSKCFPPYRFGSQDSFAEIFSIRVCPILPLFPHGQLCIFFWRGRQSPGQITAQILKCTIRWIDITGRLNFTCPNIWLPYRFETQRCSESCDKISWHHRGGWDRSFQKSRAINFAKNDRFEVISVKRPR